MTINSPSLAEPAASRDLLSGADVVQARPIFVLSPTHRDAMDERLAALGVSAVVARRVEGAARRFLMAGAQMLVVDARGAVDAALEVLRDLHPIASVHGARTLLIADRDEGHRLREFAAVGFDAYLPGDCSNDELLALIGVSVRGAQSGTAPAPDNDRDEVLPHWSLDLATGDFYLDDVLREQYAPAFDGVSRLGDALRAIGPTARLAGVAAYRSLARGARQAMFVQPASDSGPFAVDLVHHLVVDDGVLTGSVEAAGDRLITPSALTGRDGVTGLPGETSLNALLSARLERDDTALLLVKLIGIDRVNDNAGEAAGDEYLRTVASRLDRFARNEWGPDAIVSRLKGTRFAMVAPADVSSAQLQAESLALAEAVCTPIALAGTHWQVGCQSAVVDAPAHSSPGAVLRGAALKLTGDQGPQPTLDIGRAITGDEVRVFFQPQFAIADDAMVGVEALARWDHPELGKLGAAPLVSAARRAGVLPELTAHIHDKALAAMARWPAELRHVRLSLNVTVEDLARSGFAPRFHARLAQHGVDPARITAEITEDAMVADMDQAVDALAQLKSEGVAIAVDDFGAGYAGLSYLRQLPIDYLKIDAAMVQNLAASERDRLVMSAVFDLARSLGVATVAEGIETPEQLAMLARGGCTFYQGFLRSGAVASDRLADFL
ncbi:MAG: EAL domain-containing protein [Sphingomonadales bacterium]|nr:EAL domain-containing protein [Sphingomonadales bacterium]